MKPDKFLQYDCSKSVYMNGNPAELVLYVQAFPEVKYFSVVFMVQCYSMDFYAKKTFVAKTSFEALRVYSAWKEETFDKTGDIITKKWCEWNDFNIKDYRLHTSTLSTMLNAQDKRCTLTVKNPAISNIKNIRIT